MVYPALGPQQSHEDLLLSQASLERERLSKNTLNIQLTGCAMVVQDPEQPTPLQAASKM